jgi:hypothetical protein
LLRQRKYDPHSNSDTNADCNSYTNTVGDANTNAYSNSDTNGDCNSFTNTIGDANTNADTVANAIAYAECNSDANPVADTNIDPDAYTHCDTVTNTDAGTSDDSVQLGCLFSWRGRWACDDHGNAQRQHFRRGHGELSYDGHRHLHLWLF